jgi:hypothetical protein
VIGFITACLPHMGIRGWELSFEIAAPTKQNRLHHR